jgi:DNA-binding response OmpR family regulator
MLVNQLAETTLIFRDAAKSVGAELTPLETAERAARHVRADRYDVIFVDPSVANFSRQGFTHLVRQSAFNSQTPIVLISAPYSEKFVKLEAPSGVSVMAKPSNSAELLPCLQEIKKRLLTERRKNHRLSYRTGVNCIHGGRRLKATSVNLSATGILLEMTWDPKKGDDLELHFQLAVGETEFHALARVVRLQGQGRAAIAFQNLPSSERERLHRFLEAHLPASR